MEMRRFDVWVGRLAAAAGLAYVILCSLWPLDASAADGPPDPPGCVPSIVVLAVVVTLALYRRWHDPEASLDAYDDVP